MSEPSCHRSQELPESGSATNQKRIAIILPTLQGGGAEIVNLILAREFIARGHTVDFVLMQAKGELLQQVPAGCEVLGLEAARFRNGLLPLVRYLRKRRPDALLASMWPLTGLANLALLLARGAANFVAVEHCNLETTPQIGFFERRILRRFGWLCYGRAVAVVAVSQGAAGALARSTGLHGERVTVIHNPSRSFDESTPPGEDAAILNWWSAGQGRILAIGALKEEKDYATLFRGFAKLCERRQARLVVLGEGRQRNSLTALAQQLGISDNLRMPGFCGNPFPFLQRCDAFATASRSEGFCNVILEALACGAPVVSTDCNYGPGEILENGAFGRLVPVGDAAALAEALDETLSTTHDCAMLRRRAAEFSPAAIADRYLQLLFPAAA